MAKRFIFLVHTANLKAMSLTNNGESILQVVRPLVNVFFYFLSFFFFFVPCNYSQQNPAEKEAKFSIERMGYCVFFSQSTTMSTYVCFSFLPLDLSVFPANAVWVPHVAIRAEKSRRFRKL